MAQGRRDLASQTSADIAQARGTYTSGVDQAKAAGQDSWNSWAHEGAYTARDKDATRDQDARKANWDRSNITSDANVAMNNERAWWEGPGKSQALWDRQQGVVAGASGQAGAQAAGLRGDAKNEFGYGKLGADVVSGYAKSQGGG